MTPTPSAAGPPPASEEPPAPPDLPATPILWPGLDRLGFTQAIGGLVLGLIALFSSYDHITVFSRTIALQQQWGILFIAASVATVFVDAELASRSRLRAADEAAEERKRQARVGGRQPRPAAASASGALAIGDDHRPDRRAVAAGRLRNPPDSRIGIGSQGLRAAGQTH